MAESGSEGSWWTSMIATAKEKSVTALSATKRDLAEFVSVLSSDTTDAVKHAGMNIKGLMQVENPDEPQSTRSPLSHPPLSTTSLGMPYDRSQAQLFSLQSSPDTFLSDPLGVEKEYQAWTKEFDVQSHQSEISQLLVTCPHIRTIHGKLVPAKVSYENFWQRYFFKLGLLQQEEQRRADLMARVQPPQADLEWEELEEGEGEGEGVGGGEGGGEREQSEGVKGEEVEGRTDAGDKSQADLVEVASSVIEIKSEHLRSESSDSFVCVSEDLPQSERSPASPDENEAGDWEYLKMAEVGEGERTTQGDNHLEGDKKRVGSEDDFDLGGDSGETADGEGERGGGEGEKRRKTGGEGEGEGEGEGDTLKAKGKEAVSESSDWESWDD